LTPTQKTAPRPEQSKLGSAAISAPGPAAVVVAGRERAVVVVND